MSHLMRGLFSSGFVGIVMCASTSALAAQEASRSFDIPAQALSAALSEYSRQSDVRLDYSPELVAGKTAPEVRGSLTPSAALNALLAETGLQPVPRRSGAIGIATADGATLIEGAAQVEQSAASQDASTGSGPRVDDIVVTAQRRSERIQDVPLSVQAFSSETLAAAGVVDTRDIALLVPGLLFNKSSTVGVPSMRGIINHTGTIANEAPVAMFVDGVYIPNKVSTLFSLKNVERIEVLKGPQGTLFGRNATAGVINIVTREPSHTPTGNVEVGYGNYDTIRGNLYVSTGLTDKLAADLAVYVQDQGKGFGRNVTLDIPAWYLDEFAIRSKWLLKPGSRTKLQLAGGYDRSRGTVGYSVYPGATAVDGITTFISMYDLANSIPSNYKVNNFNIGFTIDHDLGWAQLTNILAYQGSRGIYNVVQTGSAGPGSVNVFADTKSRTWTEEIRLSSPSSSLISWVIGLYYFDDYAFSNFKISGVNGGPPVPVSSTGEVDTKSYAAFGQVTMPILQGVRGTVGLRYTHDRRAFDGSTVPLPGFPNSVPVLPPTAITSPPPDIVPPSKSWGKLTWRAAIDFDLAEDVMGYVYYNRGFKSGTYNISSLVNPPVDPEILDAFEAGIKSELFDRRVKLNIAGFLYYYDNLQLQAVLPDRPGQVLLLNAAKSKLYGVDVDFQVAVAKNFTVSGGFEWLHAKYTSAPGVPITTRLPNGRNSTVIGDASGNTMHRAPKFVSSLAGNYVIPTESGDFSINATWNHNSGYFWDPDNRLKQTPYDLINASVMWTAPSRRWDVKLWVSNLLDIHRFAAVNQISTDVYQPADPRTYGVAVRYNW